MGLVEKLCDILAASLKRAMPFHIVGVGLDGYEKDGQPPRLGTQKLDEVLSPLVLVLQGLSKSSLEVKTIIRTILMPSDMYVGGSPNLMEI